MTLKANRNTPHLTGKNLNLSFSYQYTCTRNLSKSNLLNQQKQRFFL